MKAVIYMRTAHTSDGREFKAYSIECNGVKHECRIFGTDKKLFDENARGGAAVFDIKDNALRIAKKERKDGEYKTVVYVDGTQCKRADDQSMLNALNAAKVAKAFNLEQ